jgi:hypothetical protein
MIDPMGRGGRFGKYGEQKRLERLRKKRVIPLPLKTTPKSPRRKKTVFESV